jgi:hypothetical protein
MAQAKPLSPREAIEEQAKQISVEDMIRQRIDETQTKIS